MAEKDLTEKILEGFDDVFADIVNVLLFSGRKVIDPDELTDQATVAAYKADGKIREIDRDVAKRWKKQNVRIACVGMENQSKIDKDMPLRIISYDGAEYRFQLLRENENDPRYPVVTLVLYFGYEQRWNAPLNLHGVIDIPEEFKPFVPDYKINLFEIAYLSREQVNMFTSDFKVVADYFVQMRENGSYIPEPQKLKHVQSVFQMLSVFTGDKRFEEAYNEALPSGGVTNMCEALDIIEQRGIRQGLQTANERVATDMLLDKQPLAAIKKFSTLTEETILAIAQKLGVQVVR